MKKIFTLPALAALLILVSCHNELDSINENPNNMERGSVHPASVLPNVLFYGAEAFTKFSYNLAGEIIQYTVSSNTLDAYHRYQIPNGVSGGVWNQCARWGSNADHMIELARKDPTRQNFEAIGLTMRAYYMQILTDSFGDAPFTEAFGAVDGKTHPAFDAQKDIYLKIIEDLRRANSLYDLNHPMTEAQGNKDFLYHGNLSRWQKFTNSLLMRVLMRCSSCNEMNSEQQLKEIYNNPAVFPIFASEEDAAIYRFTGIDSNLNPYGSTDITSFNSARRAAEFIIDQMRDSGDPRISLYFVQVGGVWKGAKSGAANRDDGGISEAARLNKTIIGDYNSPFSFMNYDEVLFIWAEAAQRGLIPGGQELAKEYYKKAIEASIRHWSAMPGNDTPVTDLAISQFLNKVPYDGSYEQLMTQKYVALFWCGFEAWAEYRRTEYPSLKIAPTTMNDHILPRRFGYPVNTASTNPDNYAVALQHLRNDYGGDDDMKTPVWWSKYRIEHFN